MNEVVNITKEKNQIKRQYQRAKTYYALMASSYFDKAVHSAKCDKPNTFEQAKYTSDMVNFFFKRDTTPAEFMNSVEDTSNKSIEEYQNFKKAVSICPFDKRALSGFAHWYSSMDFEVSDTKCHLGYIISFGLTIQEKNNGNLSEPEMLQAIANLIKSGDNLFPFHPRLVRRAFIEAVKKFEEIEQKVKLRRTKDNQTILNSNNQL